MPREPDAHALRAPVEVREQEKQEDEDRGDSDAAPERRVRDHLLEAEEVPRGLGRVRRMGRVGRRFERRVQDDREDEDHEERHREHEELRDEEIGPRRHGVVGHVSDLRERPAHDAHDAERLVLRKLRLRGEAL